MDATEEGGSGFVTDHRKKSFFERRSVSLHRADRPPMLGRQSSDCCAGVGRSANVEHREPVVQTERGDLLDHIERAHKLRHVTGGTGCRLQLHPKPNALSHTVFEGLDGVVGRQPSVRNHHDAFTQTLDFGQNVRREDDGAVFGEPADEVPDPGNLAGIETTRWLVENQYFGVMDDRLGQPDTLTVPLRQTPKDPVLPTDQPDLFHHGADPAGSFASRYAPHFSNEGQVRTDTQLGVERGALGQVPHFSAHHHVLVEHVMPGDHHLALRCRKEPGEHSHCRGLSGPIGTNKPEDLATTDLERDLVDGSEASEPLGNGLRRNHGGPQKRGSVHEEPWNWPTPYPFGPRSQGSRRALRGIFGYTGQNGRRFVLIGGVGALGFASAVWSTAAIAQQQTVVADRIVAVVGDRLVLASDVSLEAALAPFEPTPVARLMNAAKDPQQAAIDRAIVRGLAGNAAIYVPTDDEILTRQRQLRAAFPDDATWARFRQTHGLQAERLQSHLYSRLVVDRYILRNVKADDLPAAYSDWIKPHRARTSIRMVPPIGDRGTSP